uniref:Serine/threonine-protein kinase PLK4-like n=2 Tax=Hirondellea gigas TaxID=1518452 RepID=A0A6A7FN63_9CRUS
MGSGVVDETPLGLLPLDPNNPEVADVMVNGDIDDEYEIEREPIARGKFAAVRRARHRLTNEIFAAKYVRRRRRAKTLEAEAEARHEVAVLVKSRAHSHIAHLHKVYETRHEYIILLEFGAGGDLQKLLDEQVALSEDMVRVLMLQVLMGLRFLHNNSIAHLDIKPQNLIMMGSSPVEGVKLVDFGLSRVISQETELTQIMGTPDYVAPEVINFEPVGLATDMWSVGVITYVFLTGCTPFGGDTDQETFVNITTGEFDFPEELFATVSEDAKDFISCLLLKKPRERLRVEDCLNHSWLCSSVYSSESPGLYTLPESDGGECAYSPDSAYSSDSNGSPTFLDQGRAGSFTSTLTVASLCQCPIPEEQQQQQEHQTNVQVARIAAAAAMLSSGKRLRGNYMSVDMEETLKAVRRRQQKSARRASLVIDDPRTWQDERLRANGIYNHQSLLNINQDLHENRMAFNNDYNTSNRLRHSESFDCGIGGTLYPWDCDEHHLNQSLSSINPDSLTGISKPWQKLCNGSVFRAVSQLTHKNAPKKKKLSQSKSDLSSCHPEITSSKPDILSSKCELRTSKPELRLSNSDMRASKSELRSSRHDLRSPHSELRGSKSELRASKHDLRASRHELRGSKQDLRTQGDTRSSNSDIRSSKSDLRSSKSDLRRTKADLRSSSHNLSWDKRPDLASLSRLDMSLSRLDLAHEQLNHEEQLEQLDTVRGDLTLPRRRVNRSSLAPLLRGNALHMSFRVSKSRDFC